jgi:hypothetical protein
MYSIIRYCIILSLIIFFVEKGFSQLTPIDWEKIHALFEDDKKEKDPCKIGISPLSTIPRLSTTLELGFITFFDQEAFSAIREFRNVSNDSIPPFTANIGVSYRYSNRWLLEANVGFISDNTFPKAVMSSSGKIHFLMKSKKKEKTFNTVFLGGGYTFYPEIEEHLPKTRGPKVIVGWSMLGDFSKPNSIESHFGLELGAGWAKNVFGQGDYFNLQLLFKFGFFPQNIFKKKSKTSKKT